MDITEATEQRLTVGIEALLEGQPINFGGVRIRREGDEALHIECFSEWEPQRSDLEMARSSIRHAKGTYQKLCNRSKTFRDATAPLTHQYLFCYDYGNGSIELAREEHGEVVWTFEGIDG